MIKLLLKLQARSLFASAFKGRKTKTATTKTKTVAKAILAGVLTVYVVAALMFSMGAIFYLIFDTAKILGQVAVFFMIFALLLLLLCLFSSVFTAQNQLFEAKDNELLLSMPIRPRDIMLSRFLLILLSEYAISFLLAIPAVVIFCWLGTPSLLQIALFIVALLILPFFSLAVGCLLGWLLSLITARMRHKSLFYVSLFIAVIGGYMYFVSDPVSLFSSLVTSETARSFFDYIPPISLFGKTVANSDPVSLLYLFLWCAFPLGILLTVFAKRFIQIATTRRGLKKREYVEKTAKPASPLIALTKKELRRFFSLPNYIINSALGIFMEVLFCGYLIVSKDGINDILAAIAAEGMDTKTISSYITLLATAVLTFAASQSVTTSCSLSLEGNRLWIPKTLPVLPKTVFLSKILSNLCIGYPILLLASAVCVVLLPLTLPQALLLFLIPLCALPTFSLLGMAANVRFPRFDWVNETAAIKQTLSVFIGMMGSMIISILPIVLYFVLIPDFSPVLFLVFYLLYFLLIAAALCLYLFGAGQKRFQAL